MYTAERQLAQPYLPQVTGTLFEQWYLLHHRMVRIVTNRSELAQQVKSYLYYAQLLAEYTYEHYTELPVNIPFDLLWQAGERLYKPVALTCYLFETEAGQSFPPAVAGLEKPAGIEWEEISNVDGPMRARWKKGMLRFREYQAYPGVSSHMYSVLDKADLHTTIYIESVADSQPWFTMRFVFYMVLGAMFFYDGLEIVHAGAIALDGRGALLVGAPASGKSTLVLSCLQAGMQHLADDVLFLGRDDDAIHMYAFPEDIGVRPGSLPLLGHYDFMQQLKEDERQKLFIDIQQHFRAQVISSAPLNVLLFVHVKQRDTVFRAEAIPPAQAVSILVQEYISRNRAQADEIDEAFALFSDVAKQAPAYRLWLTPDPVENANQVRNLLIQ